MSILCENIFHMIWLILNPYQFNFTVPYLGLPAHNGRLFCMRIFNHVLCATSAIRAHANFINSMLFQFAFCFLYFCFWLFLRRGALHQGKSGKGEKIREIRMDRSSPRVLIQMAIRERVSGRNCFGISFGESDSSRWAMWTKHAHCPWSMCAVVRRVQTSEVFPHCENLDTERC